MSHGGAYESDDLHVTEGSGKPPPFPKFTSVASASVTLLSAPVFPQCFLFVTCQLGEDAQGRGGKGSRKVSEEDAGTS
jgi:hypothetical protein